MATMDIFEGDAFSIIELTRALENIPFKPALLSGSALFSPRGVRARTVVIESRDGTLSLIPFSERGSAYEQQIPERREMRAFICRQFKKQDVLWASEIQGVRDHGSESATQQVQAEVARKLGRLRQDAETTFEYHLLNGIQGLVKDPRDNATVVNYFTEFAITPATEIDFDLDNATPASGALRKRQSLDLSAHHFESVRVRGEDSVLETIDMSLQGGQRRPDLMSEIRQEPGTGLVGAGQVLGHLLESDGQVRQLPAEAVVGDGDLPSACSNLDRGVGQILDGSTHPASDEPGEKDSCQHSDRCRSQ